MSDFSVSLLVTRGILAAYPRLAALLGTAWPEFKKELVDLLNNMIHAEDKNLEMHVDDILNLGLKRPEKDVQDIFRDILRQSQMAEMSADHNRAYTPELEPTPVSVEPDVGANELRQAGAELLEKTVQTETPHEAAISKSPPEETANYVNFTFTDISRVQKPRELPLNEGFLVNRSYKLTVCISLTPDSRSSEQQPRIIRPEETEESIDLYVALFTGEGINIVGKPLDILTWPAKGPSNKNAEFKLDAIDTGDTWLDVYIYHKTNLLYTARFEITIKSSRSTWRDDERPITWTYQEDRDDTRSDMFQNFADIRQISERALNLAIQSGRNKDEYRLTAFMGRAELPARVTITRAELNSHLVHMRGLLDELRKERVYIDGGYNQSGEYVGDYIGKSAGYNAAQVQLEPSDAQQTFKNFMKKIAGFGSQFRDRLFSTESGQLLRKAIEEYLKEGDIIQIWIDKDAGDFVYPWAWLYDHTVDPDYRLHVQKDLFWGYKYIIEQLPQFPETMGEALIQDDIPSDHELRVKIGVFNFVKTTTTQKKFFTECSEKSQRVLKQDVWDKDSVWQDFLPECDSQILYFFSHGHTAKPATQAGQEFYDMVTGWKEWITQSVPEETEGMRQYRLQAKEFLEELEGPMNLLSETYIKLNRGNLLLPELQQGMNLKNSAPLVFLNMCESAQVFPNISGGLIDIFLKKGARGVIGTEIPMLPHFADLFSRRFFEAFFSRQSESNNPTVGSIGRIMFELRREFLDKGNPLGFAYTLFGDATTRLSKPLLLN